MTNTNNDLLIKLSRELGKQDFLIEKLENENKNLKKETLRLKKELEQCKSQ